MNAITSNMDFDVIENARPNIVGPDDVGMSTYLHTNTTTKNSSLVSRISFGQNIASMVGIRKGDSVQIAKSKDGTHIRVSRVGHQLKGRGVFTISQPATSKLVLVSKSGLFENPRPTERMTITSLRSGEVVFKV